VGCCPSMSSDLLPRVGQVLGEALPFRPQHLTTKNELKYQFR
jgi:hypothetical protein